MERLTKTWNVNINWLLTGVGEPVGTISAPSDAPAKQITDTQVPYINRSSHVSVPRTDDQSTGGIWFENLPESEQIGLVFKVIYRWSRDGKVLLRKTLDALLGDNS